MASEPMCSRRESSRKYSLRNAGTPNRGPGRVRHIEGRPRRADMCAEAREAARHLTCHSGSTTILESILMVGQCMWSVNRTRVRGEGTNPRSGCQPVAGTWRPHQEPSGRDAPLALGHPRTKVRVWPPLPSPTPGARPRPSEPPPRSSRRRPARRG